jgi:hypothetical protein
VQQNTGGMSLTVLRAVLTKWAVQAVSRARGYRPRRRRADSYRVDYYRGLPRDMADYPYWMDAHDEYDPRRSRERREYREPFDWPERFEREMSRENGESSDPTVGVSLPIQMV